MRTRLKVRLDFSSDFHVGTGAGLGRVVDAVIARTASGEPVVPGSSLKGLARDAAMGLPAALRDEDTVASIFGVSGATEGAVRFGDATPASAWVPPAVHGRSARDRTTGGARDDALFRVEDAAACAMVASVVSDSTLGEREMLLLVTALRRIEAIGGQRRRGKGQVSVTVEVIEGPEGWARTRVPGNASVLEATLRRALGLANELDNDEGTAETGNTDQVLVVTEPTDANADKNGDAVLWVFARADAALVLSSVPQVGNTTSTLSYVPGTSLRGAVANLLIRNGWSPSGTAFRAAFTREELRFGPLYPCESWDRERSFPLPSPASLLTCKYHPGLRGDNPQAHGIIDVLAADDPMERCGGAEVRPAALVPLGGVLQSERDEVGDRTVLRAVNATRSFAAHVRVDPETQRAKDGMLYGHERVAAGVCFAGCLWGPTWLLEAVHEALDGRTVAVGKGRTRGHGDLTLYLRTPDADSHHAFPGLLPSTVASGTEHERPEFTFTLYSDLIALDELLRPVTRLDAPALWSLLDGTDAPPFEIVRGYSGTRTVLGFNGVPRRPRTADVAIVAGSTWRFRWTDTARRPDALERLTHAQDLGLGLRRGEGFGRVIVELPLHLSHLDQTRGQNPDAGLATVLPHVPSGSQPLQPRKPSPPPPLSDTLPIAKVPAADRAGLARMLWCAAQEGDPAASLERAIEARRRRSKAEKPTDRLLAALVKRANEQSFAEELRACAVALEQPGERQPSGPAGG